MSNFDFRRQIIFGNFKSMILTGYFNFIIFYVFDRMVRAPMSKLGHRGANHPVKNIKNNKVEITSQNHGFEVTKNNLPSKIEITHKSLFDSSIEGIKLKNKPVFSVQYHPESNPGPQDSHYLFNNFIMEVKKYAKKKRH